MHNIWNANNYKNDAGFVADYGQSLIEILDPQTDEYILDLGCGDGTLSQIIAENSKVLAVDASRSMIDACQTLDLDAEVMDGQALDFNQLFDGVFTNAALHWMPDDQAVLNGVYQALKPGGRFVGEFGGQGNIQTIIDAMQLTYQQMDLGSLQLPWFFPSHFYYENALKLAGFTDIQVKVYPRPTPLESGMMTWLEIFSNFATQTFNPRQKNKFLNTCVELLKPALYTQDGWFADYVRIRFQAKK